MSSSYPARGRSLAWLSSLWRAYLAYPIPPYLAAVAAVFIAGYFRNPSLPSFSASEPTGWLLWQSQGILYEASRMIAAGDLGSWTFDISPVYPALAAPFTYILPWHPFVIINLVCLLVIAHLFARITGDAIGKYGYVFSSILFVVFIMFKFHRYTLHFVIPRQSTLMAVALAGMIYLLHRNTQLPALAADRMRVFGFGLLSGLLIVVQPVDAVAAVPLIVLWLYQLYLLARQPEPASGGSSSTWPIGLMAAGLLLGPALYSLYSGAVLGTWWGIPDGHAFSLGAFLADIPEKLVSMIVDPATLYPTPWGHSTVHRPGIAEKYPFFIVVLITLVTFVIWGGAFRRAVALAVITHGIVYLAWPSTSPWSFWQFAEIHRLKWVWPWLLFLLVSLPLALARTQPRLRGILATGLGVILVLGLSCVRLEADAVPVAAGLSPQAERAGTLVAVEPRAGGGVARTDFIDLVCAKVSNFHPVSASAIHIEADGRPLGIREQFQVVPTFWGARIVFVRPVRARTIRLFISDDDLVPRDGRFVQAGRYSFHWGAPVWIAYRRPALTVYPRLQRPPAPSCPQ